MDLVQSVVLGIIQGLTEFLPISSTAHLRIVPALLGWSDPGAAFTAVIQLGTLLAVLIYFWKDLIRIVAAWFQSLKGGDPAKSLDAKMGWAIVIGTIPVIVLGVLFKKHIEHDWRSLYVIAASMIGLAVLLAIAEAIGRRDKTLKDVTIASGIWVGCFQAIALIPGASRSGSTITGGLFAGFDRPAAARFSFLLSVPSILAAGLKELFDYRHQILGQQLVPVVIATVVSFAVGYWSIAFLLKFLQTRSTSVFIVYRLVVGVALLILLQRGILNAVDAPTPSSAQVRARVMTASHVPQLVANGRAL